MKRDQTLIIKRLLAGSFKRKYLGSRDIVGVFLDYYGTGRGLVAVANATTRKTFNLETPVYLGKPKYLYMYLMALIDHVSHEEHPQLLFVTGNPRARFSVPPTYACKAAGTGTEAPLEREVQVQAQEME